MTAATLVLLLRELGVLTFRMPQNARLVPQRVVDAGPKLGALQFGFEMGTGSRTYVTSSLPYLLVLALALAASPIEAVVAGAGFGLGRALMSSSRTWSRPVEVWDEVLLGQERALRLWTFALGGLAAAAIALMS
ncbi:hypothetical protein IMY96_11410 [Pimelobacter simplex]|nr:hypothetical protein [Pimelobacter simplex]